MEDNIALDTSKQKQFVKSIKGIKKLIKKNEAAEGKVKDDAVPKIEGGGIRKKRKNKGLVYLSHIPHGFYENEMTQYFKQFGVVTNARVIRSKRTGNSKGYAFVEFKEPTVAEIVADTMNNYLMGKRLIKAKYIPPEKQRRKAMRKHWSQQSNPGADLRMKVKKAYNTNKDEEGELKKAKKLLSNLSGTKKKLTELEINYDFFTPVDVPEVLLGELRVKEEKVDTKENIVETKPMKKGKKETVKQVEEKSPLKSKKENEKDVKLDTKETIDISDINKSKKKGEKERVEEPKNKKQKLAEVKDLVESNKVRNKQSKQINTELPKNANIKQITKGKVHEETITEAKKQKKKNVKTETIMPLEDFIKIQQDDDSDSSLEFDSDEYEKVLEGEDDDTSDGSDDDEDITESDDESEEELPPTKQKNKPQPKVVQSVPTQKQVGKKQEKLPPAPQMKRKAPKPAPSSPKKPKFEKQNNQKQRNKQFKKKKIK